MKQAEEGEQTLEEQSMQWPKLRARTFSASFLAAYAERAKRLLVIGFGSVLWANPLDVVARQTDDESLFLVSAKDRLELSARNVGSQPSLNTPTLISAGATLALRLVTPPLRRNICLDITEPGSMSCCDVARVVRRTWAKRYRPPAPLPARMHHVLSEMYVPGTRIPI